jgi:DNA repair ATPase RecN
MSASFEENSKAFEEMLKEEEERLHKLGELREKLESEIDELEKEINEEFENYQASIEKIAESHEKIKQQYENAPDDLFVGQSTSEILQACHRVIESVEMVEEPKFESIRIDTEKFRRELTFASKDKSLHSLTEFLMAKHAKSGTQN